MPPYDQIPEVVRPEAAQQPQLNPEMLAVMQLFERMMQPQAQQSQPQPMDYANADVARLAALRNDPQDDRNKMYMPGVDNAANPFSNGFFKSPVERQATINQRQVGMPSLESLMTNPTYNSLGQAPEAAAMASPTAWMPSPDSLSKPIPATLQHPEILPTGWGQLMAKPTVRKAKAVR